MPRTPRIAPETGIFHITCRGNNRMSIFHCDDDYFTFLKLLRYYKAKYSVLLFHYVLMNNHVHLIISTTIPHTLTKFMHGLNLTYAQYYRKKYKGIGHFWQDRFKSILIETDRYLLACGRYIELNPVRAKIVTKPEDYLWSSYRFYAFGEPSDIVDINPLYASLGNSEKERQEKYRELFISEPVLHTQGNHPRKRGRPRKVR